MGGSTPAMSAGSPDRPEGRPGFRGRSAHRVAHHRPGHVAVRHAPALLPRPRARSARRLSGVAVSASSAIPSPGWAGCWPVLERRLNRERWSAAISGAPAGVVTLVLLLGVQPSSVTVPAQILMSRVRSAASCLLCRRGRRPAGAAQPLHACARRCGTHWSRGGLAAGRQAVAKIVGRNTAVLDEAGVARAAIESLAENFSDGIVAPAFWLAVARPSRAATLYKAANTADSMIGHRTPRYAAFGWAAARFDDAINLPASRLAALWIVVAAPLAGGSARGAWAAVRRDARRHRSPNAGWPEAAFAGALDLKLAGPRIYGNEMVDDAFMGRRAPRDRCRRHPPARWPCTGWPALVQVGRRGRVGCHRSSERTETTVKTGARHHCRPDNPARRGSARCWRRRPAEGPAGPDRPAPYRTCRRRACAVPSAPTSRARPSR